MPASTGRAVIWRSHMVLGASAWLGAAALAGPIAHAPLDTRQRACGAIVAAAGALLSDIDTPGSRLARSLGPVTQLAAAVVGRIFGGHRRGTHSLAFCVATGALSATALAQTQAVTLGGRVTLSVGQLAAAAIGYFAAALTVALLLPQLRGARAWLTAAALVAAAAQSPPPAGLVTAAITIGCLSHLAGDMLTPEGIEPLWPFSDRRVSLRVIKRTGDTRETVLVLTLAALSLTLAGGVP